MKHFSRKVILFVKKYRAYRKEKAKASRGFGTCNEATRSRMNLLQDNAFFAKRNELFEV